MGRLQRTSLASLAAVSSLFFSLAYGQGQQYCSSQNTAGDSQEIFNPYQSNGSCRDSCRPDGYAFAIVQYTSCWCSNYIPANQLSTSECGRGCPGFPSEQCGNADDNLYGYIPLGPEPAGTQGGAAPSPTQSDQSESPASSGDPNGPQTSIKVITVSGAPVTEFITSTPSSSGQPGANDGQDNGGSGGVSTGAIAGGVVGGLAGLAAIGGLMFFLLMRRRRRNDELLDNDGNDTPAPRRNTSTLSRTGLLRSRPEKEIPTVIVPTPTYRRGSSHGHDSQSDHASPTSERRNSRPLFYDQRLNPSALMALENRSHTSIATIEDNRDYTRTLNVRNPDPE